MCAFGGLLHAVFSGKGSVSVARLLLSENGFLLFSEKLVAYFFGVDLFELGQVSVTYQKLLHYSNSLKQVLKARLLSCFSIPSFLYFFSCCLVNPEGDSPSRTDHLVGGYEVWDLLLVTITLKPSLSELRVVQKKA